MPARIVLVHDDQSFMAGIVGALSNAGYQVAVYGDSLAAWDALVQAEKTDLLITRVLFPAGQPHGVSLARHLRHRRSDAKVLFVCHEDNRAHVAGEGTVMTHPIDLQELLTTVECLLGPKPGTATVSRGGEDQSDAVHSG